MIKLSEPIARDDNIWQGHPDVAYHDDYVFIVWRESDKHLTSGGTKIRVRWGKITEEHTLRYGGESVIAESINRLNCPRISVVDNCLWIVCDEIQFGSDFIAAENDRDKTHIVMWRSSGSIENGSIVWDGPIHTNIQGIVPDRMIEFKSKYHIATHVKEHIKGKIDQLHSPESDFNSSYYEQQSNGRLVTKWWTKDGGIWKESRLADVEGLHLCESSIMDSGHDLHCLMRENSGLGDPAYWCTTHYGDNWSKPEPTRLFGCHRPTWGMLSSGNILVTYREQSSIMNKRCWARNTFAAIIPTAGQANIVNPILEEAIILPLDHDRSLKPDGGYTGWAELPDGRIFAVNYITDDAPKPYIRGYLLKEEDFMTAGA